jgi:hypothetical protein|uniref:EXPERA domain-containing protein n=1 Tax=Haptolina ericina TaxID=156174 RepID=A0A6T9NQG4_9EUKA|mmetsp:Transcript_72433/g.160953  ORF Transcript_72433/g.160953 Transcript_72433/m.160953 type:complete len:156 (+) Transcript_72433:94-561(+)
MRPINLLLVILQTYFMLMNVTVERCYCAGPLSASDMRFLMPETLAFSQQHNPLFLARPRWMQIATCISAYGFFPFYLLIAIAAATERWALLRQPISLFVGAKLYAITYYHVMEFTSDQPPPNLVPYVSVEGPYLLSIALVLWQLRSQSKPKSKAL